MCNNLWNSRYFDVRLCGEKKRTHPVKVSPYLIIPNKFKKLIKDIILFFKLYDLFHILSNIFDSQHVGTTSMNKRTGVAVLCCHGKSNILGDLVFSVMGTYQ